MFEPEPGRLHAELCLAFSVAGRGACLNQSLVGSMQMSL